MRDLTKAKIAATVVASSVLLSGCGLFGGEPVVEEIDPPQEVTLTNDETSTTETTTGESTETVDEATTETVTRELYLVDKNGMVVPQTVQLPKTEGVAKQVLEYLVVGGPVTDMLPNGFRAVLPQDTQLSTNMDGDTVIVDFSKEFANYEPEDELKILQAITFTLTQFDTIKNVKLTINGHEQDEMPVNGTPIDDGMNRADGINLDNGEVVDITNTKPVTLYFLAENAEGVYYVPITKRIDKSENDNFAAIVNELIQGPDYDSSLLSGFQSDAKLLGAKYENGKVTLDFNENIYGSFEEKMISKHVINSLVLSLTEQPGVESVAITVQGNAEIVTDDGEKITEPVTRPEKVNTGSF
ncbi:GerMN domain-containing protein [Cytobacillus sp. S13-E01]|uniref:GerMN domain-containing protein n=1 Tax=Cytobacillus sp. S13-E01 TaxID=3031326 RepID=UPI0023D7BC45|nr:GerMN domain-containing protein [Cytobacillus sp. S13-E01]MDF0726719.1 GerMN domain-containing protein [Cytobacillus sp. S13-E01]